MACIFQTFNMYLLIRIIVCTVKFCLIVPKKSFGLVPLKHRIIITKQSIFFLSPFPDVSVLDAGPRAGEREPVQQDGRQVRLVPRGAWRRGRRLAQALRQEVQPEAHRAAQPRQHRQEQSRPLIQF
jgi:hypothetical protein